MGGNIITLGDGNVVNAELTALHGELSALKLAVSDSDDLTDSEKLDIAVDIESLKDQLAKPTPDKTIIRQLWDSVEKTVVAAGFVEYASKIAELIAALA